MRLFGVTANAGDIIDDGTTVDDAIDRSSEDVGQVAGDMTWQDTDQVESGAYVYDPGFTGGVRVAN